MTTHIKLYPTKASALNVHHPIGGAPDVAGKEWPNDVFTYRRLTDGSFTEDEAKAYRPAASDKPNATPGKSGPAASVDTLPAAKND